MTVEEETVRVEREEVWVEEGTGEMDGRTGGKKVAVWSRRWEVIEDDI